MPVMQRLTTAKTTTYLVVLALVGCSSYPRAEPNCSIGSDEAYARGVRLLDDAPLNVDRRTGLQALERERRAHKEICGR